MLFDFYCNISLYKHIDIQVLVRQAREKIPVVQAHAKHNFCISHRRRMTINRTMNLAEKPIESIFIKKVNCPGATMKPQDMWIYPGQTLIANCQKSSNLRNGVSYNVVSIGEKIILDNGVVLNQVECSKILRLGHAQTYASCQGAEFESARLWDCDSIYFTWKHLYVGMSRAKTIVEIV